MKKLKSMADLMAATVPATVTSTRSTPAPKAPADDEVQQQQLVVHLPAETVKALKTAALAGDTTVRVVLLQALEAAGYPVPEGQLVDFRKVQRK